MSVAQNERIKLTATFLNNIAVAVIVAGFIVPLFGVLYGMSVLAEDRIRFVALAAPSWLVLGILHVLARRLLGRVSEAP